MQIAPHILARHLHDAAIEQLAADYRHRGYEVEAGTPLNGFRADLVARRGDELIVFEIKTGPLTRQKADQVARLRSYVDEEVGGSFRLVLVGTPEPVEVEIEDIDRILSEIAEGEAPDRLVHLASHIHSIGVEDAEYRTIRIEPGEVYLEGSASLWLTLQYGSDGDVRRGDGEEIETWFPVHFKLRVGLGEETLELLEMIAFDIETDEAEEA